MRSSNVLFLALWIVLVAGCGGGGSGGGIVGGGGGTVYPTRGGTTMTGMTFKIWSATAAWCFLLIAPPQSLRAQAPAS